MKSTNPINVFLSILLLALSILLTVGTQFLFHACDAMESGDYMLCHWAQRAIVATAGVLTILHIFHFLSKNQKSKAAFLIAGIPVTVLIILFPGVLIQMCMSKDMRCQAIMRPSVLVIGVLILIVTTIALLLNRRKEQ